VTLPSLIEFTLEGGPRAAGQAREELESRPSFVPPSKRAELLRRTGPQGCGHRLRRGLRMARAAAEPLAGDERLRPPAHRSNGTAVGNRATRRVHDRLVRAPGGM